MKKFFVLLPVFTTFVFIPFGHMPTNHQADDPIPVASSVIRVSGVISGAGLAGHYLFSRRLR